MLITKVYLCEMDWYYSSIPQYQDKYIKTPTSNRWGVFLVKKNISEDKYMPITVLVTSHYL